ncbi:MAG: hypothetical protein ABI389_14925 [Rhodanobacter sp.]
MSYVLLGSKRLELSEERVCIVAINRTITEFAISCCAMRNHVDAPSGWIEALNDVYCCHDAARMLPDVAHAIVDGTMAGVAAHQSRIMGTASAAAWQDLVIWRCKHERIAPLSRSKRDGCGAGLAQTQGTPSWRFTDRLLKGCLCHNKMPQQ